MRFSAAFLAVSAIFSSVAASLQPVPQGDVDALNELLASVLAPINADMSNKLKAAGLDPFEEVVNGGLTSKTVNLGVCKADAGVSYGVHHLAGLSGLRIENFKITAAEADDSGALSLDIAASINKLNLTANVDGYAWAHCGLLKPKVGISGTVVADQVTLSMIATAGAQITDSWTINTLDIKAITSDFKDVYVLLHGLEAIFNPILDDILLSVEHVFKSKIQNLVNNLIKEQATKLVASKLPISIAL
ncbi:hypothetical protein HDV03_001182 [Kappamyces sp. JEL0829]|nr:hypothetical protein HDV03_001182 [Kappamyces sp. JEL0829]